MESKYGQEMSRKAGICVFFETHQKGSSGLNNLDPVDACLYNETRNEKQNAAI